MTWSCACASVDRISDNRPRCGNTRATHPRFYDRDLFRRRKFPCRGLLLRYVKSRSAYTAVCNTGQISHISLECGQVVGGKITEIAMPGSARQYGH